MEQFQLDFDPIISQLEKENRWETVAEVVFQQWKECPNDINRLLCAGTQLWYTLLVMEYAQNDPSPPSEFEFVPVSHLQTCLAEVTRHGFCYFTNNALFNSYFGYMIKVKPYFFMDYGGDYQGWQAKGIGMICYSFSLEPHNSFSSAMYYESQGFSKKKQYYDTCKDIWSRMTPKLWGNSEVQQYFFRILQGDMFYADAYS